MIFFTEDSSTSFSSLPSFGVASHQNSPPQVHRLKVIPDSLLMSGLSGASNSPSTSPNENNKRVITTEELHHNLLQKQNLVSYNKSIPALPVTEKMSELFTQYLIQQQQQVKIPYKGSKTLSAFCSFNKNGSGVSPQPQPSTSTNLSILPNISAHPLILTTGSTISNLNPIRPQIQQASQPVATIQGQGPREMIPYKCPLCSLNYRTQAFLNEHLRKEHSVLI